VNELGQILLGMAKNCAYETPNTPILIQLVVNSVYVNYITLHGVISHSLCCLSTISIDVCCLMFFFVFCRPVKTKGAQNGIFCRYGYT
jgi:hypothetical protein